MSNNVATRVLLLVVAVLTASLIGVVAGLVSYAIEPNVGKALLTGGTAFGGSLVLMITALNFVMNRNA
ncbi:hypothetical protein IRY44_07640 [Micromonospora sp. ANENR4]|uniref:hypothetical protein n=1 Tax=Micromonospora sp. ANENR4 TaxID=2783662 RepID=UPI00188EBEF4|nr:hypothetical protein [Micromonospora sp. ANENR4]MBF5029609.1 hypothetical protein [Micromonospora sp. ANENR4]